MEEQRTKEIEAQLRSLGTRDVQLWAIAFLVMAVLAVGVTGIALPNLSHARVEVRYIPQLALGLIALVVLLNLYIASKKKELSQTRVALIRELALNEKLDELSLIDPETQLFSRAYLHHLFETEMKRSNRLGSITSLLVLDMVWGRMPPQDKKTALLDAVALLRGNFHGSDGIVRLDADRFLVLMPKTTPDQAGVALQRLAHTVDEWNLNVESGEMLLNWTLGSCAPGEDAWGALQATEKELDELSSTKRPVRSVPAASLRGDHPVKESAASRGIPDFGVLGLHPGKQSTR